MAADPGPPGLREKLIAIICKERPSPDNELTSADICERLIHVGVGASEVCVAQILDRLAMQGDVTLVLGSVTSGAARTIRGVSSELCL